MSEKQRFNKGANLRQIAEKRRERWMSHKILSEIIDAIRKQRDDANWVIYQVLKNNSENLKYKSKIKMFNWLANSGYDVENLRPEKPKTKKEDKIFNSE